MKKFYTGVGIAFVLTVIACSAPDTTQEDIDKLNERAGATSPTNNASKAAPKGITAGTWEVGKKADLDKNVITAGTYVINTPADGYNCYWERVRNFDNNMNSIIANNNLSPNESSLVSVKSTDKGLVLKGECLAALKK
jgi:hypothetical protein